MIMYRKKVSLKFRKFFRDLREQEEIGKEFLGLQGKNRVLGNMS